MKLHYKDVLQLSNDDVRGQPKTMCRRRLRPLTLFFAFILVTLACIFPGLNSQPAAERISHLPTLTRTPLPTLTPTINPKALAATAGAVPTAIPPPTSGAVPPPDSATVPGAAAPNPPAAVPPADVAIVPAEGEAAPTAALAELPLANPPSPTVPPPPTSTPPTTATAAPASTDTPTPAPTATPLPGGWVFTDLRLSPAPNGNDLLVLGNLINNTGSTQTLDTIDGLFYDSQGQMIDTAFYTYDYPINEVPQGGQIPFQIEVKDRPHTADVKLQVLADSGGAAPRQDFEFLEVNAGPQGNEYCIAGKVRNPGRELDNYLVIAAVLYDSQNKVINYSYDYFDEALQVLAGEQTQDVAICVDPLQQEVARYELEAWGL